jgi:hypothetical protein
MLACLSWISCVASAGPMGIDCTTLARWSPPTSPPVNQVHVFYRPKSAPESPSPFCDSTDGTVFLTSMAKLRHGWINTAFPLR